MDRFNRNNQPVIAQRNDAAGRVQCRRHQVEHGFAMKESLTVGFADQRAVSRIHRVLFRVPGPATSQDAGGESLVAGEQDLGCVARCEATA